MAWLMLRYLFQVERAFLEVCDITYLLIKN